MCKIYYSLTGLLSSALFIGEIVGVCMAGLLVDRTVGYNLFCDCRGQRANRWRDHPLKTGGLGLVYLSTVSPVQIWLAMSLF